MQQQADVPQRPTGPLNDKQIVALAKVRGSSPRRRPLFDRLLTTTIRLLGHNDAFRKNVQYHVKRMLDAEDKCADMTLAMEALRKRYKETEDWGVEQMILAISLKTDLLNLRLHAQALEPIEKLMQQKQSIRAALSKHTTQRGKLDAIRRILRGERWQ